MRSSKLVSIRLNAVVCELAMLPEMFSSAKDCARNPVTAVVRAPKIPMTDLQLRSGRPSGAVATRLWPHDRNGHRKPRAREIIMLFQSFIGGWQGAARVSSGADLPRAGKNCRVRSSNQAWKSQIWLDKNVTASNSRVRSASGRRVRRKLQGNAIHAV